MIEIIPTNTCPPDLFELALCSEMFAAYASDVQLDVGDGMFVQTLSWPFKEGQWTPLEEMAEKRAQLPFADVMNYETHLMVEEPLHVGSLLARVGCKRVIGHVEGFADRKEIERALSAWKAAGATEVGLAILLDTPLPVIEPLIPHCHVVQVMSIATLGKQGAPYDRRAIDRVKELHTRYPELVIEVDGGVSEHNIQTLARAGASRFGVGSAISKAEDPKAAYEHLKQLAESSVQ